MRRGNLISLLLRKVGDVRTNHREDWQHSQNSRRAETRMWIPESTKAAWNSIPKPNCAALWVLEIVVESSQPSMAKAIDPLFSLLISLLAILICLSFRRKDRLQRESRVDGPLGLKWNLFIFVLCICNNTRGKDKTSMSKHTDPLMFIYIEILSQRMKFKKNVN